MRHLVLSLLLALPSALAVPVRLQAPDGLTLHGQHTPVPQPRGALLLLHAAGQNRHEFAGIAPRLAREGYASLALDQRSGGDYDGHPNQTVPGLGRRILSQADELRDMAVAFNWLKRTYPKARIFALGSGTSGMLLFPFANQHPGVAGILAFSPYKGDLFDLDALEVARRVRVPVFVTSSNDPFEIQAARELFLAVGTPRRVQFVPAGFGLRGAVSLDPAKTTEAAVSEAYWAAVLDFLRQP